MSEVAVEFRNVAAGYDGTEVLHGISFSIRKGDIVGLLGPNGAGKTTTLNAMAGILSPMSGGISVAGLPLPERTLDVKQRIGYVPETAMLFESLTGQEFLELSGRLHDVPEDKLQARIATVLDLFSLSSDRVSRLDTYSKGMRQKILIGAALLHNPDLILLDEPLTGLDVNAALTVKDLIAALAADGKTVIYSSHVLDVVEKVCDRVIVVNQGRLIADDSPDSLKASTGQSSLENVFRALTQSAASDGAVSRVVSALRT